MESQSSSAAIPKQTSTSGSVKRRQWSAVWLFYIYKLHSCTWRKALPLSTLQFFSIVSIFLSHPNISCQFPLLASLFWRQNFWLLFGILLLANARQLNAGMEEPGGEAAVCSEGTDPTPPFVWWWSSILLPSVMLGNSWCSAAVCSSVIKET